MRDCPSGAKVGGYLDNDEVYRALHEMADPVERLIAFYCYTPDDPRQTLRRMFVICGAMDYLAFEHRATADDWLLHQDEMHGLRARAEAHGDAVAVAILSDDPNGSLARARIWIESAASWTRLRNSVLGKEALSCWYEIATWQEG